MLADLAEPVMNQGWHTGRTLLLFTFLSFLVLSLFFLIIRDSSLWTFFRFFNYLLLLLLLQIFLTIKSPKTGTEPPPPPPHYKIKFPAGAIVPELSEEIKILNSPDYQHKSHILTELNSLISLMQCHLPVEEAVEYVDKWAAQRKEVRGLDLLILWDQFITRIIDSLLLQLSMVPYFSRNLAFVIFNL